MKKILILGIVGLIMYFLASNLSYAYRVNITINSLDNLDNHLAANITQVIIFHENGTIINRFNLSKNYYVNDSFNSSNLSLDYFSNYYVKILTRSNVYADTRYDNPLIQGLPTHNYTYWCHCNGHGTIRPFSAYGETPNMLDVWWNYRSDCGVYQETVSPANKVSRIDYIYCRSFSNRSMSFFYEINNQTGCYINSSGSTSSKLCITASYPFGIPYITLNASSTTTPDINFKANGKVVINSSSKINATNQNLTVLIVYKENRSVIKSINIKTGLYGRYNFSFITPSRGNQSGFDIFVKYFYHSIEYNKSQYVKFANGFVIKLNRGWNIIWFNRYKFDANGNAVNFSYNEIAHTCNLTEISWYKNGRFYSYITAIGKGNNTINPDSAYFVYSKYKHNCSLYGLNISYKPRYVYKKWNLVGVNHLNSNSLLSANSVLYKAATLINSSFIQTQSRTAGSIFNIRPYEGVWVYANESGFIS